MNTRSRANCFYAFFFLLVGFQDSVQGRLLLIKKPDPNDAVASARWLVSQNSWGVLNTLSSDLGGAPFGYVLPFLLLWREFESYQHKSLEMLKTSTNEWLYVLKRSQMATLKCKGLCNLEGRDPKAGFLPENVMRQTDCKRNVVSFSDGLPREGSGIPYFYLTTLDPTAKNALQDQRSSFTVSEYPLTTCGKKDPENPSCAKITLTGKGWRAVEKDSTPGKSKLKNIGTIREFECLIVEACQGSYYSVVLKENSKEAEIAKSALFAKHQEMKGNAHIFAKASFPFGWPKDHNFQFFKLDIEDIFLINWFGGPKPLTVEQQPQGQTWSRGFGDLESMQIGSRWPGHHPETCNRLGFKK
ncbi:hypothetical protein SADUNF_Sadunf16G0308200 [Salix dunnii]|uniref:CREG-like beta-barrel domain-containing protein n=1 Tax=Salix dunnii TaxID=1413687 RepID=A0A835JF44_9ROSI|nr:hypothetical protein SADUNF_Sadunf16G0308200 [Salix dunnii]